MIGANGQLGSDIVRLWRRPAVTVIPATHADADITDAAAVEALMVRRRPDAVVNTAAFHNMAGCEADPAEALRIASRSPSRTLAPLAMWGLAVALDRSGDRIEADRQALEVLATQASSGLSGLLRSSGVFFYPDYELGWYERKPVVLNGPLSIDPAAVRLFDPATGARL